MRLRLPLRDLAVMSAAAISRRVLPFVGALTAASHAAIMLPIPVRAESGEPPISDENTANNPLSIVPAIQVQNYYQPVLRDSPRSWSNQPILRGILPFNLLGGRNLMRVSLPVGATAWSESSSATGIGDLTLFGVRVFRLSASSGVGVGPLLVAPTASDASLGAQKWQIGAQGTFSAHYPWGLLAGLVSYQQSVDGEINALTIQPFVFRNIGSGYYLRSSGIISFDTASGDAVVPVGLGLGKVTRLKDGNLLNVYLEPQVSLLSRGEGQPQFQVFAGFNLQFPPR